METEAERSWRTCWRQLESKACPLECGYCHPHLKCSTGAHWLGAYSTTMYQALSSFLPIFLVFMTFRMKWVLWFVNSVILSNSKWNGFYKIVNKVNTIFSLYLFPILFIASEHSFWRKMSSCLTYICNRKIWKIRI